MYSVGELNQIVDSMLHPLFEKGFAFVILDSALHALIERSPVESMLKFVRYNLPRIIHKLLEEGNRKE